MFQPPNDGADSAKIMHQVIMRKHVQISKILGEEFCRKVLKLKLLIKMEKEIWVLNLKHLKIYLVVPKTKQKAKDSSKMVTLETEKHSLIL